MRKSYFFSFIAALSLAFVSIGMSDTAIAQERGSEPVGEVSEMGGGATLLVIGSLAAIILLAVAVSGSGDEERPVSP